MRSLITLLSATIFATSASGLQQKLVTATGEARQAYMSRNFTVAEQKYEEAVALAAAAAPKVRIVLMSNLGAAYREDHKYDQAEATFRKALQLARSSSLMDDPASKLMAQQYIALLRKLKRDSEADALEFRTASGGTQVAAVTSTAPASGDAPGVVAKSKVQVKDIDVGKASNLSADELKAAIAKNPNSEKLWLELAIVHYRDEQWKEAAEAFRYLLDHTEEKNKARYCLTLALTRSGQLEAAGDECRKLVNDTPEDPNVYRLLSAIYSQQGNMSGKLEVDEQFVSKFPAHPDAKSVANSIVALRRDVADTNASAGKPTSNKPTEEELERSWVKAQMPLKVFIYNRDDDSIKLDQDPGTMVTESTPSEIIQGVMHAWGQATNGRVSFVMCNRAEEANITCDFTENPDGLEHDWAAGTTGWSDANPANVQAQIQLLVINRKTGKHIDRARFYETTLHEFGHALGLLHSGNVNDVMYRAARPNKIVALSDNDKDRILKLYNYQF